MFLSNSMSYHSESVYMLIFVLDLLLCLAELSTSVVGKAKCFYIN